METKTPTQIAQSIYQAATPVLRIRGTGSRQWIRNVPSTDYRHGPWLQADYQVLNERAWTAQGPCLYLVGSSDGGVRYVGISRNGLKHRWRLSPAFDATSRTPLPKRQLFHSQCWRHIERELTENFGRTFEVRHLDAVYLVSHLLKMGGPLAGLAALQAHGESVVAGVERWLCNHQSADLAVWNKAMTGKRLAS